MITFFKSLLEEIDFTSKKIGLLLIFFIAMPFLSMWIGGAYYNSYVNDVAIAVLDEDNSNLSRKIVRYFNENERFIVEYYAKDKAELEQLIDQRKVHMGIYIPKDLNMNIKDGIQTQVLILTDGTNAIISNNLYAGAASIVQTVSAGAAIQVIEAKGSLEENVANNMALPITFEERMLYDSKLTYMNYLMYGIFAVFLQQLMLSSMATLMSRNPEEVAAKGTLPKLFAKMVVAGTCLIGSGAFSIYVIHRKFGLIFNGSIGLAVLISVLFAVAISCAGIILYSFTGKKTRFTQIAYMLSLPTFLTCGYVWPIDQMPNALVALVKTFWPLINYARSFDEILIKNLSFADVKGNIIGLIIYILIMLPIGIWCFKRKFGSEVETC